MRKLILTVSSSSLLSGAKYNDNQTSLVDWGELPYEIEHVVGTFFLTDLVNPGTLKVSSLNGAGQKVGKSQFVNFKTGKEARIKVGKEATVWYLIERI